jgi:hypothetical protein
MKSVLMRTYGCVKEICLYINPGTSWKYRFTPGIIQMVQFLPFYGTKKFIIVFTKPYSISFECSPLPPTIIVEDAFKYVTPIYILVSEVTTGFLSEHSVHISHL